MNLAGTDIEGFSAPSADTTLSFVRSGRLIDITVKAGDHVKAGQLLARLDDNLEKAKLAQLTEEFEHSAKRESEKAKLLQKTKDLVSLQDAASDGAVSLKEVDTAKLEVVQLQFNLKVLDLEKSQLNKKIEEQKILLKQTQLVTLESGIVESIHAQRGESVERLIEIFRIVRVNPLWIEVHIPLIKTKKLKLGSMVKVLFPDSGNKDLIKDGKIIFRSSVADPGSETLKFRLEVENKELRLAGERVKVRLEE